MNVPWKLYLNFQEKCITGTFIHHCLHIEKVSRPEILYVFTHTQANFGLTNQKKINILFFLCGGFRKTVRLKYSNYPQRGVTEWALLSYSVEFSSPTDYQKAQHTLLSFHLCFIIGKYEMLPNSISLPFFFFLHFQRHLI